MIDLDRFWLVLFKIDFFKFILIGFDRSCHDRSKVENDLKKLCSDHTQRPSVSDERLGGLCRQLTRHSHNSIVNNLTFAADSIAIVNEQQQPLVRLSSRCSQLFQPSAFTVRPDGKGTFHFNVTSFTVFSTTKSDNDTTTKKPSVGTCLSKVATAISWLCRHKLTLRFRRPPPPPTRSSNTPSCRVWQ